MNLPGGRRSRRPGLTEGWSDQMGFGPLWSAVTWHRFVKEACSISVRFMKAVTSPLHSKEVLLLEKL